MRRSTITVGALFLIAIVASIIGGSIIEPVLTAPDVLTSAVQHRAQVVGGMLLELVNGVCVVGIAVTLYPMLRPHGEALAIGYVAARVIEVVVIVVALVKPLSVVALSEKAAGLASVESMPLEAAVTALISERSLWVGPILAISFGLAALPFYTLLFRSRLLPRFIPIWGFIAVASVLCWNLLELFGISVSFGMVLAVPMILNEVLLGIWLIVKGFDAGALQSGVVGHKAG